MPGSFRDKRKAQDETFKGMFVKNKSKKIGKSTKETKMKEPSRVKVTEGPKRFPKFGNKTFEELTPEEKKKAVFG